MDIGNKIRELRTMRKMSQKQLSELSGVSEGAIRKYEAGTRNPKPSQLKLIANAMGMDEFIFYDMTIDTPARIMSIFYWIDDSFEIKFDGDKDENGCIKPQSISIRFNNNQLNERFAKWAIMKSAIESTTREMYSSDEEYDFALSTIKEKCDEVKLRLADSNIVITTEKKE